MKGKKNFYESSSSLCLMSKIRGLTDLAGKTKPLTIPGKRKSFSPTGTMLLEMLKPLTIATIETDFGFIHQVPENQWTEDIRWLLHLAGSVKKFTFVRIMGGLLMPTRFY